MKKTRTLGIVSALVLIGASAIAVADDTNSRTDANQRQTQTAPTAQSPHQAPGQDVQGDRASQQQAQNQTDTAAQERIQPKDQVMAVSIDQLDASEVEDLQQRLADLGYYRGKVDGIIGPMSRAALTRYFADQQRLLARNMLGEHTLKSLEVDVSDRQLVRGLDAQQVQRDRMGGQDVPASQRGDAKAPSDRRQDNQSGDVRDY